MPWENNGGGGGRNNNGGPWGQAPGGGGGGGPRRPGGGNTPNLEDILNRGRDQFRGGIPGGRWAIVGGVLALVAFWALNSIYTVEPQEVGVELQFGAPKPELAMPGLQFHFWPIETVEKVTITENQTTIGSATGAGARGDDGLMLSGDQNIVDVRFSVLWAVTPEGAIDYLFNVRDPEAMVRNAAESAMREVVGRRPAQDIFRDDRAGIAMEVQEITQSILNSYEMGVNVNQISIENAAPPAEVADAFNEVQRAEQDEDRLQEEARAYANELLGNARGQAAALREEAAAYTNRVVQEATGEAERFNAIYAEYVNAPEVTRKRLFLETMEEVLGGSEKVLLESGENGQGVIPYLPLPELRSGASNSTVTGN
ncbi:FtsH protease activity modulator HflK [Devosia sp. SL43]|uniref:FtsH protease activity modulator HflK n=1 Tax=Devosia sp. SL43 TaxID=2806348 RepID=UPI001F024BAB|nr:FtsH protease activity modulator HflK [Devosia sp. SL43]UJW86716.1 FtsH protease activity modulator HflK [Devosia sp. SL43]